MRQRGHLSGCPGERGLDQGLVSAVKEKKGFCNYFDFYLFLSALQMKEMNNKKSQRWC
jgi:hypothetical protein